MPGNTFIIECVVALLIAVESGKFLLYVAILLRSNKPETFNDETQVTLLDKVVVRNLYLTHVNQIKQLYFVIIL